MPVALSGDAAAGHQVFRKCQACHSIEPGKNGLGPSLAGIVGEKAAAVPGYSFSPAMKASNLTWDAATLDAYLTDPQKVVPGNKMPFPGLKTERERSAVIAFLAANSKGGGEATAAAPSAAPKAAPEAPKAAAAAVPPAPAAMPGSSYVPGLRYTLRSGIAEGRMVFIGVGGSIDGQVNPSPTNVNHPDFTGHVDGRYDVSAYTDITAQARLHVGTDNPGSPNVQAGLAEYPVFATFGGTFGFDQKFNRLQISGGAMVDRTVYQDSKLTDGEVTTNDDRNYNQYGGVARASYELTPAVKPYVEVEGDSRVHDEPDDRNGYQRDSDGGYVKAGSTFEFSRLLTGEVAAGYSWRTYQDPRLKRLDGLLTSASLVWTATGLTTVRLDATSSINETTLEGVSGSLSRDYSVQVDHAFRRWLIGTAKFGYGTTDYEGARFDRRYFAEADLIYKLTRTFAIKGTLRRDWLKSDAPGVNSSETVMMLGVRVQR